MAEPKYYVQMLADKGQDESGPEVQATPKMQIHIEGNWSGSPTVKLMGRLLSTLTMIQLRYEDGTAVAVTEDTADIIIDGLARFSEIQLVIVGGDGSTNLNAYAAEISDQI